MSDVIVADVQVREHRGRRVTTITVIEGRGGDVWPARPTSVPPVVREELSRWVADDPGRQLAGEAFEAGGLHVGAGAHLTVAEDGPTVGASLVGFHPTRQRHAAPDDASDTGSAT